MTKQVHDTSLSPPQPLDQPGTRPPLNLAVVIGQVNHIQTKLAAERVAKAAKAETRK